MGIFLHLAVTAATARWIATGFVPRLQNQHRDRSLLLLGDADASVEEALQRTAAHLETLRKLHPRTESGKDESPGDEREFLYRQYLQRSANSLKEELKSRGLPRNGRKPDLAQRLADYDLQIPQEEEDDKVKVQKAWEESVVPIDRFAGLRLSEAGGRALGTASFPDPSPIQSTAIPLLAQGQSAILHAETGSGKTLAYLLPVTEQLWLETDDDGSAGFCLCLTPTRELAAQVAGIASVLAPRGSVRLVSHPTNLLRDPTKDRGELPNGGRMTEEARATPRLFIGSAKCIMTCLYGDGKKMPAPPTSKPEAMFFLRNTRWLILDEVDRLLNVKKSRSEPKSKVHEKPAAVVASAVTRSTLGRAQVIAASATVGRPLKRELARVLGLPAQDCPQVLRGEDVDESVIVEKQQQGRAVTIPPTVDSYVVAVDDSTVGKLLTTSFYVINSLPENKPNRILLVLTRGCGINTQNAIGALKHFGCRTEPKSLLDALEADGTDNMIQIHREVSGAKGVGESCFTGKSPSENDKEDNRGEEGYLLVTGEDTVRGLHLDGLDMVVIVGRPHGPDEYMHIAGRTGRAGRHGKVINVVSDGNAAALKSWERMLDVDFHELDIENVSSLD